MSSMRGSARPTAASDRSGRASGADLFDESDAEQDAIDGRRLEGRPRRVAGRLRRFQGHGMRDLLDSHTVY